MTLSGSYATSGRSERRGAVGMAGSQLQAGEARDDLAVRPRAPGALEQVDRPLHLGGRELPAGPGRIARAAASSCAPG